MRKLKHFLFIIGIIVLLMFHVNAQEKNDRKEMTDTTMIENNPDPFDFIIIEETVVATNVFGQRRRQQLYC